jgi:hypothetical protein
MTKKRDSKKPRKSTAGIPAVDIYEQFGNQLAKGGGIDRLILFGEPTSSGEFDIDPQIERWLVAIDEAEQGDKSLLVKLMQSGSIPTDIVPHIGDLIKRCYHFKKPNHRPATASHRLTDNDLKLNMANCDVDDLLAEGKSLSVAIKKAAADHGMRESLLHEFHAKRRGPDRRVKARGYKRQR